VITSGDGTTTVYGHRLVIEGIAAWATVDEEAVP
jgi:hypothetical protein